MLPKVKSAAKIKVRKLANRLDEIETLHLKLAACSVASLGYDTLTTDNPYWSATLGDVQRLRDQFESGNEVLNSLGVPSILIPNDEDEVTRLSLGERIQIAIDLVRRGRL